jgi:gliding motility-associated-like protein
MIRNLLQPVLLLLLVVFTAIACDAQVVINEFCTANYSDFNPGDNEDWVEIYNPTASTVNIGGYWLSNDITNPQKWQFPATAAVNANSYLLVLLSGAGAYAPNQYGYLNTSFRVTQTDGDDLVFSNASGTILESFDLGTLGAFQANHSYGRTTNGAASWGIFTNPTENAANSGTTYAGYATQPSFNIQAGYQSGPINVSITAGAGESIYYTLDGSEPNNTSTPYLGPINISATTTLRAIAYAANPNVLPGLIETNTYFFGTDQHGMLLVNIAGTTLGDGSWGWGNGEFTHLELFAPGGAFLAEATGDSNEHGNDSNAYDQRGFDYITRDALGYDNELEYPVFATSDRTGYERLIFKAAANDNYPFSGDGAHIRDAYVHQLSVIGGLHLDERKTESCVLYINGQYWGVYEAREKVDDIDYTKHYFNQGDGFVDFIKTWGGTWNEYGTATDWNNLVAFITGNDMTVQANYDYVLTQYNHMSLIDYFILNGYTVCTDWLNWNTAWWRGRNPNGDARRWRYALWDNDATFGHYVNYTGVPSTAPSADPCQIDNMGDVGGQGHVPVLNALFNNESFLGDYVQRYATLSNTIFSCDRMLEVLDSMIAVIEPEMQRHCNRWGGTLAGWQANVDALRDFIEARCNNTIVEGIEGCYDVTAYQVNIEVDGIGEIEFATLPLNNTNTPYSGTYFSDVPISLIAATDGAVCGNFAGWEITSGTGVIADPNSPNTTMIISSDVTLVAHFTEPASGPITILTQFSDPAAGLLLVNGLASALPNSITQNPGEQLTLSITENEWYDFLNWESNHTALEPNASSMTLDLVPCQSDTITAIFDYIEHYTIDIAVDDLAGGYILANGDTIFSNLELELLGGETVNLTAVPDDIWSQFAYWESDGNPITPDATSANITLEMLQSGSITAVFVTIPHHAITIMVEPAESGTVLFEEVYPTGADYMTTDYIEAILEGEKWLNFKANPSAFWEFDRWTALHHNASPNSKERNVRFELFHSDTIVAHFTEQPFTVFVPNSFSPNQDGINDVFLVEGNAIDPDQFHLQIMNRWGQVVFESRDPKAAWTGNYQGGDYYVSDQVYSYVLSAKSVFEISPREYTGSIWVIR